MATPTKNGANSYSSSFKVYQIIATAVLYCIISAYLPEHRQLPAAGVMTELLFNEGTGTTTADGSGNNHTGTLVNGPVWGAGKYGQGLTFNGTNSYVNIADHADYTLNPAQNYTWSAWVKSNDLREWSTVWSQTVDGNNFFYFYAHTTNDPDGGPVTNGLSVYWWNGGGTSKVGIHSNNNVLTVGQWSYVTVTYDASLAQASRFTIYVNGADVTNRSDVSSVGTLATIDPNTVRVGSNQPFGEYLNGSIDEVRYYTRLLSLAEIQSDMNIGNTPDTQSPAVNITAPAAGNVSGTINVTANATDNVGVTGVQFLLDGANLGAEDIAAPYSVSWNTIPVTNGNHNLTARARDAVGNTTTSAIVAVNVNNVPDTVAPTVNITSPTGGTVSGTINVNANAADNIGVTGVQFLLNGANLGAEDVTAPYSVSWNTVSLANGNYTLSARARDAVGNTRISSGVIVTVSNVNLVAAYGFNENTGTLAGDNSGNNNNGTLTNGPTWSAAGKFGAAVSFDGTDDYINIPDANSLDLTTGMTIEAWVNPTNVTGYKTVICKENSTNNLAYVLSANNNTSGAANQRPNARIRSGSTTTTITGTNKLVLNTWAHLACTYDGTTLRYYQNGVQVATVAVTASMTVTTNPLRIGGSVALGAQYFAGLIDEVRVYNRALSATEIQADMNTPIAPDLISPTVAITAPTNGSDVAGTINVTANASDNISVSGVQFKLNGANLGAEDVAAPYSVSWNTLTTSNGLDTLLAIARDATGNTTTSDTVIVNVINGIDNQAPSVNITAPPAGNVNGTINVTANASDNVGVLGVQFKLNGTNLGTEDLSSPYSISWNTLTSLNGPYTLTAVARDAAGNTTTSAGIAVTINNDVQAPSVNITAPAAGEVSGTINVTADASDNVGVKGVQFKLNGANLGSEDLSSPYSVSWNTLTTANGSYTLTAVARDSSGNTTTSADVIVTVNNVPDTQVPTVGITAPAAGNVSGTINVTANAADNVGVVGVQFKLNGANLGTEDLSAPYSYSWNTATSPNGNYTLTAVARDAAGNTATSATVNVTIANAASLFTALPFNEGSGTATADISGANHPGTLVNSPVWGAGKYGQGLTFNGTSNYVNIADHNDFTLDPTQNYTWSAWVKNTSFKEWSTVWSQTIDGNNFFYFYAHTTSDPDGGPVTNGLSVYWWSNGGSNKLGAHSNNNVLTAGQWSYVAITYDASQAQNNRFSIYVNGVDVTARTDVSSVGTLVSINPTNIRIGSNQAFGEYLNGSVDEVRYYRRLLTLAEINSDMNTPMGVVADNTPPTVNITAPPAGNVSGTVDVTANASDNIGVIGVQFLLDGVNLGAEDVSAPYSVAWNTTMSTAGNHVLTARARDAAGNNTTSAGVTVTIVPDFSFTLLNSTRNINPTDNTNYGIGIGYLNGFTGNITLSVSGLPAGVTANYPINPVTSAGQTQLNINSTNATPGIYTLTLTATAQSIVHTQQASLVINGGDDFGLNSATSVQTVAAGNGTSYFINITKSGNFASPVSLSVAGLGTGMTASFNPVSGTPPVTSVLTITTSATTPVGNYNFTVQGASGALVHTLPISLTVLAAPPATWPVTNLGSGWDMPVGVAFTKDGSRLFVWEKGGKVYVCNRNASTQLYDKQATPVLDISAEVGNWNDMGCLGFALDPNFEANGLIYLSYIVDRHYLLNFGTPQYDPPPGDNASAQKATIGRITRYQTVNSGGIITANLGSRMILLGETKSTGIPILYDSHGVGTLTFASDGTLIASCGDAASYSDFDQGSTPGTYYVQALADSIIRPNENVGSLRSQMLTSLNGKILRLDPATGNGMPSNPFYDAANPRSARSRTYALGLRNPFRISIKPGSGSTNPDAGDIGEIYVGDVGVGTWEELNVIKEPGTNCGWPLYEGLAVVPQFANPVPNKDEPNPLFGTGGCTQQYYTFQDLFKQVTADNAKTVYNPCNPSQPIGTGNRFVHRRPIIDYKHDADIARVGIFSGNTATVATIGTPASGVTGTPFRGNANTGGCYYTGTLFPSNFRNTFLFGDYGRSFIKALTINFTDVLQKVEHFADVSSPVCLTQNPLDGTLVYADVETNAVRRISYGGNQFPVVKMTSNGIYGPSPFNVTFNGSNSFDPEGGRLTYSWNFGDGSAISTVANPPVHSFTAPAGVPTKFVVTLTIKDSVNATAVDSIIISVNNTPPVVNITSPIKNSLYEIGPDSIYAFTATVTDAEHGPSQLKYEWQQILRHGNHEHPGPIDTVKNSFGSVSRIGCNGDDYYWLFRLKVTDAAGLYTMDSSKIFPHCVGSRVMLALRKFSVTPEGTDRNLIKWVTEQASAITGFELEKGFDGINFFPINWQDAKTTVGTKEYSFYDDRLIPGTTYYRLKMIETGDAFRYSE
ncbi:MAG TPA: Ig-like domain-containing protein, partial [Chitinophagaceae bacterium]|nr:Ig-like domain-containing protein [Chitinophagaceae bacterium]